MQIFTKEEIPRKKKFFLSEFLSGKIYIYPTDTVYGVGCIATDEDAVNHVREMKKRPDKAFSVIAPSKEWILENCEVDAKAKVWLDKLPGPYTLILKQKNKKAVAKSVNVGLGTLGVRMPAHWITDLVKDLGLPIVTPSANVSGKEVMTSQDDLDPELQSHVDYMFDEGELHGKPSRIIDLTGKVEKILR